MSTILEALKKSEQERKLNKLPTLADMQAPQEPSRWPKIIAIGLAVIVLCIAVVSVVYWWQSRMAPTILKPEYSNSRGNSSEQVISEIDENQERAIGGDEVVVNAVSFSEFPERRFAMVNGKMVREGEFVEAGLMVEKIEIDSVVLNLRGKTFSRKP